MANNTGKITTALIVFSILHTVLGGLVSNDDPSTLVKRNDKTLAREREAALQLPMRAKRSIPFPICPAYYREGMRKKRSVNFNHFVHRHVLVHQGIPSRRDIDNFLTELYRTESQRMRSQSSHTIIVTSNLNNLINQINQNLPSNDNTGWVMDHGGLTIGYNQMRLQDQRFNLVVQVTGLRIIGNQVTAVNVNCGPAIVRLGICLRPNGGNIPAGRYHVFHIQFIANYGPHYWTTCPSYYWG